MAGWTRLTNMELSDEEKFDMMGCAPIMSNQPDYPYGLRISLTEKELSKLKLKADCEVGDLLDIRCFAKVTSVSTEQRDGTNSERVELQITDIALEDEMSESTTPDDEDDD